MTHTDIVEMMARAIYEGRNGKGAVSWQRLDKNHKLAYILDGQKALAAITAKGLAIAPMYSAMIEATG